MENDVASSIQNFQLLVLLVKVPTVPFKAPHPLLQLLLLLKIAAHAL
jgi:hypothetical protein